MRRRKPISAATNTIANENKSASANDSTHVVRDTAWGTKNRTIWAAIKARFKLAAKAATAPEDDQPRPKKRRRRGGNDGRGIIMRREPRHFHGEARAGRYDGLATNSDSDSHNRLISLASAAADMMRDVRDALEIALGFHPAACELAHREEDTATFNWEGLQTENTVSFANPLGGLFDGDDSFECEEEFDSLPDYGCYQ